MTTLYVDNIAPNLQSKVSAPNLQLPSGSVLQVVESNMSGDGIFSTSSTGFVDVGLSASITPTSTSSKILVRFNAGGVSRSATANEALRLQIVRGATSIYGSANIIYSTSSTSFEDFCLAYEVLDSPSTTSATTYKIQMRTRTGNTCSMNTGSATNTFAVLTLMEIAG